MLNAKMLSLLPAPLQVFELVKNSLRAVHDRFEDSDHEAPPIRLVVAEGEEDVTIKASACVLACLLACLCVCLFGPALAVSAACGPAVCLLGPALALLAACGLAAGSSDEDGTIKTRRAGLSWVCLLHRIRQAVGGFKGEMAVQLRAGWRAPPPPPPSP